jgi:DNA polymerase III alpha subunit (gram-positive type)
MVYLMYAGLDQTDAFNIMEFVRKGMPTKKPDT